MNDDRLLRAKLAEVERAAAEANVFHQRACDLAEELRRERDEARAELERFVRGEDINISDVKREATRADAAERERDEARRELAMCRSLRRERDCSAAEQDAARMAAAVYALSGGREWVREHGIDYIDQHGGDEIDELSAALAAHEERVGGAR